MIEPDICGCCLLRQWRCLCVASQHGAGTQLLRVMGMTMTTTMAAIVATTTMATTATTTRMTWMAIMIGIMLLMMEMKNGVPNGIPPIPPMTRTQNDCVRDLCKQGPNHSTFSASSLRIQHAEHAQSLRIQHAQTF